MQPVPTSTPTAGPRPDVRTVVERPPSGLLRGGHSGPRWLVALLGGLALLVTVAFYLRSWRKRRLP